jgi:hypothetical protein
VCCTFATLKPIFFVPELPVKHGPGIDAAARGMLYAWGGEWYLEVSRLLRVGIWSSMLVFMVYLTVHSMATEAVTRGTINKGLSLPLEYRS